MTTNVDAATAAVRNIQFWLSVFYPDAPPSSDLKTIGHAGDLIALCDMLLEREKCGVPLAFLPKLYYLLEESWHEKDAKERRLFWDREKTQLHLQQYAFSEAARYDLLEEIGPPAFLG